MGKTPAPIIHYSTFDVNLVSVGNRTVRQWSAGFRQRLFMQAGYGAAYLLCQYSQLDRALWSGPRGAMNFAMLGFRYYMPPQ